MAILFSMVVGIVALAVSWLICHLVGMVFNSQLAKLQLNDIPNALLGFFVLATMLLVSTIAYMIGHGILSLI